VQGRYDAQLAVIMLGKWLACCRLSAAVMFDQTLSLFGHTEYVKPRYHGLEMMSVTLSYEQLTQAILQILAIPFVVPIRKEPLMR
jgi:hypothetical protein